jgi:hypothetical protein
MNKKFLRIIFIIGLLVVLLLVISAEENLTNPNSFQEESSPSDSFYLPLDSSNDLNANTLNISKNESTNTNLSLNYDEPDLTVSYTVDNNVNNETINNTSSLIEISPSNSEEESNETTPIEIPPSQPQDSSTTKSIQIVIVVGSNDSNDSDYTNKIIEYTSLTNITQNNSEIDSENSNNTEQEGKKDNCLLQSPGKRVEIKDCGNVNLWSINVEEVEKSELEKEVIISSEEHVNKTITINTTLTTESKKENIHIYWKNEGNLEITTNENFSVKYYDEDNNGLIDIISWNIPHLSEQIFEVIIDSGNTTESSEQLLLTAIGPVGQTRNPINFKINVNYSGVFNCELEIGGNTTNITSNQNYSLNLPNDNYNWGVVCFDVYNSSVLNATSGSFVINEGFSSSLQEGKLYFLDLVENKIKNPEIINITSTNPSNFVVKIIKNGQAIYTRNFSNSTYLIMNETLLNSSGMYNLSVDFDEPSPRANLLINFSVASANLLFNTSGIKEGESVKITAIIASPLKKINPIILDYGDGSSPYFSLIETNQFNTNFSKKYSQSGKYTVNLTATVGGNTFTIQKNGINVTTAPSSGADKTSPSISLLEPTEGATISDPIVSFLYKANDDVKIQNCTFKLYGNCASMNYCSTSSTNMIFPTNSQQNSIANNYSVQNNKKMEIDLQDFENGFYEWLVECYDNSSNYDWEVGFFEVDNGSIVEDLSSDYPQKEEIENLKEQVDEFLTKDFNPEEKGVLEDLNILNDTKYYKKRLLDIQQFFEENYKYVSTEALREQKTNDYLAELEDIKNKIPKSFTIKENYEYIKNSVDANFESLIQDYFDSTNTNIGKSSIQKLARINKELQNEISVSAKIKDVQIEYENGTNEITFVKKEISLNNESYDKILEIVPKSIAENANKISFITENKVIKEDPIFEINYGNLDKKEIIYYIAGSVKLKDFEETETVLFEDSLNKFNTGFTGFFVMDFSSSNFAVYLILAFVLLIVLLFIVPFTFKKLKMLSWRKEPNVVRIIDLINDIEKLLREKEIEKAREKYYKIKEIYPVLPSKTKTYFYKKINEMLVRIDKKDIFGLVKEYQEAKRKWNKEDYMRLYEDIKKIYERLPEKDRKKVYEIINRY